MFHFFRLLPTIAAVSLFLTQLTGFASAQSVTGNKDAIVKFIGGTTGVPEGTAGYVKWMTFRDRVAEMSNGEIAATPMVTGELGSEETVFNGLRRGRLQVANISGLVIGTLVPEVALLQAPYLFNSEAEADYIYDEVLFEIFEDLLAAYDLTFLSWDEVGFHHIYGKSPILVPSDIGDARFRIASGLASRLFAEAVASDIIPLSFTDNVVGLQTGLVNAGGNAVIMYAATGIAEEAPHLSMTYHLLATNFLIASTKWLDGLSPAHQDIIRNGWLPIETARAMSRDEKDSFLARADEIRFTVHELSDTQRDAWHTATEPVIHTMIERIGGRSEEIYNAILSGKTAYRAQASVE